MQYQNQQHQHHNNTAIMGLMDKISDKLHHKDKETEHTTSSTTSNTTSHITSPNDTNKTTAPGTGSHGLSTNNYGATPASSGYGSSNTTHSNVPTSNTTTTAGMAQKARMDADNIPPYGTAVHSSSTANRVDPRVDDSTTGYGRHNEHNSSTVPHSSSTANRVDPRVNDSTSHGRHNEYNSSSGPHAWNMANKADPRIDSDNSRHGGVSGSHGQFADTMSPSSHGAGYGTSSAPMGASSGHTNFSGREPYSNTSSNTHAPGPYGTREEYGSTGPASHTLGPHSSNAANVVDPRVQPEPEKMKDHKTVGPHHSDMLNKLDPRVDSDPRHHGYSDRDPTYSNTHSNTHSSGLSHNDNGRFDSNALDHNGVQKGGFETGPHARLENRGSIPTAGGLPVGEHGNGPYNNSSHSTGLTGSHGGMTGSHGGVTGSHGGMAGSQGGLTGSHGGLTGNSYSNEPYGASHSNSSHAYGSNTTSGPHTSDMANKVDPRVDSDNSRFASSGHGHGPSTGTGFTGSHTAGNSIPGSFPHDSHNTSHHTSSGLPGTSSHNGAGSSDLEFRERELALRQRELELKEREMEHGMRRL